MTADPQRVKRSLDRLLTNAVRIDPDAPPGEFLGALIAGDPDADPGKVIGDLLALLRRASDALGECGEHDQEPEQPDPSGLGTIRAGIGETHDAGGGPKWGGGTADRWRKPLGEPAGLGGRRRGEPSRR